MFKDAPVFSGFSTNDIGAAKRFYGDTLGLRVEENTEGLTIKFANGGSHFIYPKDNHEPATFTVLNLLVKDIDQAVDKLVELGIHIERYDDVLGIESDEKGIMRGKDANRGPNIAWFKDPAGNILSVIEE